MVQCMSKVIYRVGELLSITYVKGRDKILRMDKLAVSLMWCMCKMCYTDVLSMYTVHITCALFTQTWGVLEILEFRMILFYIIVLVNNFEVKFSDIVS